MKTGDRLESQRRAPLDEGYSWIILFASFSTLTILSGAVTVCGLYYVEWLHTFEKSRGQTVWVCAASAGVLSFSGPLSGILVNRFGHRFVVMGGGLLMSFGLLSSSFAKQLFYLYITYGLITGIGFGLTNIAATVIVACYFDRYRTSAIGLAMTGAGLGGIIYPLFSRKVIDEYGWRGSLIISSGVTLNIIVFGALLRPVTFWEPIEKPNNDQLDSTSIKKLINISLFKDIKFWIFVFHAILFAYSLVYFTLLLDYAKDCDIDKGKTAWLLSIIGISAIVARLAVSVLGRFRWINQMYIYAGCFAVQGSAIFVPPLTENYVGFILSSIIYGVTFGILFALLPSVVAELFGIERLGNALGYLILARGLVHIFAGPVSGKLREITASYRVPFYAMGIPCFLSSFLMVVIILLRKRETKEKCAKLEENVEMKETIL